MKRMVAILSILLLLGTATAESSKVWVLCQPDSYVNIRARPSSGSQKEGYAICGDSFETDGKTRSGYTHVFASVEAGEGWISNGFIVWDEPEEVNTEMTISSKGRVALRRSIGGNRRKWGHNDDKLKVYWVSDEWSVTDQGFIKTEFLEE